jgi:predicted nucleic acid-binding protein
VTQAIDRFLVDTGIIVTDLRGDQRARALLNRLWRSGTVLTSVITAFEVLRGCRTPTERQAASNLFQYVTPAEQTYDAARAGASLVRQYAGIFTGPQTIPDAMIGGVAIASAASLVTLNRRQFGTVPLAGLTVLMIDQNAPDWTAGIP